MCESFFATLECELIDRSTLRSREEARDAIFGFIEGLYNTAPSPLSIRLRLTVQFEKRQAAGLTQH